METAFGHLTYCSNIHPGVTWEDHFNELKANLPAIREQLVPGERFALGLRLAHEASLELEQPGTLEAFRRWLEANHLYVFTMNGFPYGNFHGAFVKDQVHAPDWTTEERTTYTLRLFRILAALLPEGMEGGVSTPPLSYRYWWKTTAEMVAAREKATQHILQVVAELIAVREAGGPVLHLDIEPEPDGILDNGADFFAWYREQLLPMGIAYLKASLGYTEPAAREAILTHVQLCYDVCHFAVSYETPETIVASLLETGIRVGKIQVSSALQADLTIDRAAKLEALKSFDEPVYLHQVVARTANGALRHYRDLDQALAADCSDHLEWRIHFHVPLFIATYGLLNSTQDEIVKTLELHKQHAISPYLEVETYTWGVLPEAMQLPVAESIVRELNWVKNQLK